jgi:hypothetical protein
VALAVANGGNDHNGNARIVAQSTEVSVGR